MGMGVPMRVGYLNETTKVMIQSLIGNNHLYSISNWADDIRRDRRDTAPWHYVSIPLGSAITLAGTVRRPTHDAAIPERISSLQTEN